MKYFALILVLMCTSCTFTEKDLNTTLLDMKNTPINLCLDKMICVYPDSSIDKDLDSLKNLKLIIYNDTTNCSMCYIEHLESWNNLLTDESLSKDISFIFIIEAQDGESKDLVKLLKTIKLHHSIYVDYKHIFRNKNPKLPDSSLFHTFLIDKSNSIILVGNPEQNEQIKKLLYSLLKKIDKKHL